MKITLRKRNDGFTIVELLIVIVVIGILAAIVIVAYTGVTARASYATMRQDLSSVRTAIELYHVDKGEYPNSADCVNTSGEYNFQDNWCGWDQGRGDSFVPGLAPQYLAVLPTLSRDLPQKDSYVYQSRAADGSSPGVAQYQLLRYRAGALGGLNSAEKSNNSDILNGGPGGYTGSEAWGFKSNVTTDWW